MLVDEVEIKIKAGNGGDGRVSFRREKFVPKGGPDGGDGGNGGNVYFVGVDDITALQKFRFKKDFSAENGEPGGKNRKRGAKGKDLILEIPSGTVVKDLDTGEMPAFARQISEASAGKWDLGNLRENLLIDKGGKGGRGNWHFKSSTHQTPREFEYGGKGEEKRLFLELRLIADIGLIGLPNAGKSSILNELTRASVRVAPYPFTTLEPNLGAMDGLILADLPGLIEGASEGKGLGIKFLKHVKRTKVLVHCLSSESQDALKDYQTIRKELGDYDSELLGKQEIILITKSDLVSKEELEVIKGKLKGAKKEILGCSIYDDESLEKLKERLKSKSFSL